MSAEFVEYTTQLGDRWDTLAYKFYGNTFKYAPLIMANPSVAIVPFLPVGTQLIIPALDNETVKNEDLPPWKQ